MRTFLFLFYISISMFSKAQKSLITHDIHFIQKGFCHIDTRKCLKDQIKYMMACKRVGDFYYSKDMYDSAFFYYNQPANLSDHAFLADTITLLKNNVISKAAEMLLNGIGIRKDTVSAYFLHHQFPISTKDADILSKRYFDKTDGIFHQGFNRVDSSWLFELNPFKLTDTSTLHQLFTFVKTYSGSKKFIHLTMHMEDNFAGLDSEIQDALHHRVLYYIDSSLKLHFQDQVNILIDSDRDAGHTYIKGICIPSLELSFH